MRFVYELLLLIGLSLYLPRALWRKRLPHRGWMMRLGRYPTAVHKQLGSRRTIWVHAVSVGEIMAVQPLVHELLAFATDTPLVLSTITPSGFQVASRWLGERGVTIYAPLDFRLTVRWSLEAIRPRMLLLVESELWPTLVHLTKHQQGSVAVVNGRISERAYRRYLWVRPWLKGVLESVDLFLMQTEEDARRLVAMGAPPSRVQVLGSLKWDASLISRPKPAELAALSARLGLGAGDALIVAGSTHRGEERALLEAFQGLRAQLDHVRLIIAPRHLERVGEVEALSRQSGLSVRRVSQTASASSWDVAIVDTLGQLPAHYGLATVVFVGGSLIPHGGQNPLEPASLGKPIIFGPSMENFAEIARQLLAHQAAYQLQDRSELTSILQGFLVDQARREAMGQRAQALVERLSGTSTRTLEALKEFL